MLKRAKLHWRDKTITTWIEEGNANIRYFHITTLLHRRHSAIEYLKHSNGEWIHDRQDIGHAFTNYFFCLFTSTNPNFLDELQSLFCSSVSSSENDRIMAIPEIKEICSTLFNMGTHKSPGPDGFNPLFFKTYWHTVGVEVTQAVQHLFQTRRIPTRLNHTFIALIPKIEGAHKVEQFRPIALCSVCCL